MFPAKAGALSYIILLNQRYKIPIDACMSSFLYSFLFDILTLPPFLLFSYYVILGEGRLSYSPFLNIIVLILMIVVATIIMYLDSVLLFLLDKISKFKFLIRIKKFDFFFKKINEIVKAFKNIKKSGYLGRIFFISLLMRGFKYLGLYSLFFAIALKGQIIQIKQLSYLIFGITAADFTAILPIQGIAGFGTWETAWSFVFNFFGIPKEQSAYIGLLIHLYAQSWEYTIGFIAFCLIIVGNPFSNLSAKIKSRLNNC